MNIKPIKQKLKHIESKHIFFDKEGYWLPVKLNYADLQILFSLLQISKGHIASKSIRIIYNLIKDKEGKRMWQSQIGDYNKVYDKLKEAPTAVLFNLIDEISLSYGEELKQWQ